MFERLTGIALAVVALVGCGQADGAVVSETDADTAPLEAQATPIPDAFHGAWGIMGDCSDPNSIVQVSAYAMAWPGQGDGAVINVQQISGTQLEMEEAPNPEYPDADLRFGLSLSDDGQSMTLSSPQSSAMGLTRCADAGASSAASGPAGRASDGLPAVFHGRWDDANGSGHGEACDPVHGDIFVISATTMQFDYGLTRLSDIRRIDDRTYEMTAQHTRSGGEAFPGSTTRFSIDETGRFITETIEESDPFIYVKCE